MSIIDERSRNLNKKNIISGPIIYWMSRDQRASDNWALLAAQELAIENKQPLLVVFNLVPSYLEATSRHYQFMLRGLKELELSLSKKNISFKLLNSSNIKALGKFATEIGAGAVITDFSPLRINRHWKETLGSYLGVALIEVDAHNIVPAWLASDKQEFAAYTFRPKIKRLLPSYLLEFPKLKKHPYAYPGKIVNSYSLPQKREAAKEDSLEFNNFIPGERAAKKALTSFIEERLVGYNENRNNPILDGQSNLSPYFHFGLLSAQRVALKVNRASAPIADKEAYLEELIVRRELSDNFCFYNDKYDSVNAFPNWAKISIEAHKKDKRDYLYSQDEFESQLTHDKLWNAAQFELVKSAKMHGYMRMYWAKKILEWTPDVGTALAIAIYLNDKYSLDGRDPNGYAGIAWSIGGLHDRAWFDRPIFGKIRYMNEKGAQRKFDVEAYIAKWS